MKRLVLAALVLAGLPLLLAADKPSAAQEPKTILMIGNSLTYTYGIPAILEKFAEASGKTLEITAHTTGGTSLEWHWTNPSKPSNTTAKEAIDTGGYDLVILQEFSAGLVKGDTRSEAEKTVPEYVEAIRRMKMRPMLYMAHPTAKDVSPEHLKPIIEGNAAVSEKLNVPCAPVALAFIRCNEKYPRIALIDQQTDRKYGTGKAQTHQSPFGSYLAACVLYATIYRQTPVGLSFHAAFDGKKEFPIEAADARAAQEVAWAVWQEWDRKHPVRAAR